MTRPHEGATLGGLHVLTDAELNRTIKQAMLDHAQAETQRRLEHRRAQWRRNSARRYARYSQMCVAAGVAKRGNWTGHIIELEGR